MKSKRIFYSVYLFLMITSCWGQKKLTPIKAPAIVLRNRVPVKIKDSWQLLDIEKDTMAGTSLQRAYHEIIKKKKGKEIIIAIIDVDVDIQHEDLKQAIWVNKKEIPDNNIDDDHNGYIDDLNGWNFLGNPKGGQDVIYANTESTRILKSLQKLYPSYPNFKGNTIDSLRYLKATDRYKKDKEEIDSAKSYASQHMVIYRKGIAALEKSFHKTQFNMSQYDSLYIKNKNGNAELVDNILYMRDYYRLGKNYESLKNDSIKVVDIHHTTYNEAYYDRAILGDNENDIKDIHYGNNNVYKNAVWTYHGTIVSGVLAANRANKKGIEGFSDQIKIMPLRAIPTGGSEHDKDVALAIHYAVDNGAKIINMSFGKTSSMHLDWIKEAFLYAQKHDVLLIAGAGNDLQDSDINPFYPIDYDISTKQEYCNNFIKVGAISLRVNKNFLADFTNYGKQTVDVFAPGYFLKTTYPDNKYAYRDGTSMASPIVSGVAALVRSYYPKLTASQVKQIILDSGVSYDLQVQVPGEKEGVLKPFSEMSKSGKVVNAYNALLMAATYNKIKNKL